MNKSKKFARRSVARGFAASLTMLSAIGALAPNGPAQAQITAAPDGTGTLVNVNGNQIDISGGTQAGANLFQSFQQFGLSQAQIANFLSNPSIANILSRVSGGDPSVINGLIQVSGSNANLFLMNPTGVIFGPNAQLNVPASFTATTANAVGVGNSWFNATGANDFSKLGGDPNSLAFTMNQPGAIINTGNLAVGQGKDLTVAGGSVISTGTLAAPGGNLLVTALPGGSFLRISQAGSPLSIDIPANPNQWDKAIPTLASMVANIPSGATGVEVRDGKVYLAGSDIQFGTGDALVQQAGGNNVNLFAANNLFSAPITGLAVLSAAKNLDISAGNNVVIRDTKALPFLAIAGEQLNVTGVNGVDIWALNHQSITPFQSGGDLAIASNGIISGDAHFTAAGQTSFLKMNGAPGEFVSYYDPIISSTKDVKMGNYTGASLKIETLGQIYAGNITITTPDVGLTGSDPDVNILTSSPSLILRAGLTSLANPVNLGTQHLLISSGGTQIHTLYNVNALGTAGFSGSSAATGINNSGIVSGYAQVGSDFFPVFFPTTGSGAYTGNIGYSQGVAYGVSDAGVVPITVFNAGGQGHAAAYYPGYGMYDLGSVNGSGVSYAYSISNNGYMTGFSSDGAGEHLVLWTPSGALNDLGNAYGTPAIRGYAINNSRTIAGAAFSTSGPIVYNGQAFVRDGTTGLYTSIPLLSGYAQNQANGINDAGVVVGSAYTGGYDVGTVPTNSQAFLYTPGDGVTALGMLPGTTFSAASSVNNHKVVVGYSGTSSSNLTATIFGNGTAIDVNSLLTPGSDTVIQSAVDINDNGQIAATGSTSSGQIMAMRLDPSLTTDGGISVGSITTAGGPVILDGPKVELRGDIRTNGGDVLIQQASPVTINKAGFYDTLTINSAGGDVTLNGPIDQVPGRMNSLSVLAGDGTTTTNGLIGSLAMPNTVGLRSASVNVNAPIRSLSGIAIGADNLSLQGTLRTTQDVTLEPYTAGRNVGIARDGGPGAWNLDQATLLQLQPGVNRLNIGGVWVSTNTVYLGTPTLNVPLNIKNTNLLVGPDVDLTWSIVGGSVGEISGYDKLVTFEGAPNLLGGSGNDIFKMLSTGGALGLTDGGGGTNTLDYSVVGSPVMVMPGNTTQGTATKFHGGIIHFQNVIGTLGLSDRNTFQGTNANNTFNLTGANQGDLNGVTFQNFGNLNGGNQSDTFVFNPAASLAGGIDGGAGTGLNSLDYSHYGAPATVRLGDQMSGTATAVAKTIIRINDLVGDPTQQNTLLGRNSDSTYTITGGNTGVITGVDYQPEGSTYKDFQTLQAGDRNDTFILAGGKQDQIDGGDGIDTLFGDDLVANTFDLTGPDSGTVANANGTSAFQSIENLTGGSQDDTVHIASGGSLSGNLDGSPGSDTLDYTGNTNNVTVDLGAGTATGITGSLTSIENYKGGAGTNTLIGTAGADAFTITANNQGIVGSTGFNGFESLQGGDGDDTFTLNGGVVKNIDGGTGSDQLIGDAAQNNTFTLTGADSGTVANGNGTAAFASIENLSGGNGSNDNTFQMAPGGTLSGDINGAGTGTNSLDYSNYGASATVKLGDLTPGTATAIAGSIQFINDVAGDSNHSNTLIGLDGGSTYTITGPNAGVVTGPGHQAAGDTFRNFQTVQAGSGDDTFALAGGMLDSMDGGAGDDVLIGDAAQNNTFNLTGADSGNVQNGNGTGAFASIENLTGGNGTSDNTFNMTTTGTLSGNVSGGGTGTNSLDYSNFQGSVQVKLGDLTPGTATAIGGTIQHINDVTGNANYLNTLMGPDVGSTFTITGPSSGVVTGPGSGPAGDTFRNFNDVVGGTGDDTFGLDGGMVHAIDGGAGSDRLVGDNAVPNTFNLTGPDTGNVENANGTGYFSSIENLSGGAQPDTFKVIGNGSLTSSIDGAPGSDTLDYSSYVGQVSVNLETGEATAIGSGMTSIENLIGNSTPGNELIGPDADADWQVTGPRTGHVTDLSNGNRTNFKDFDVLQGGTGSDRFNLPIDGGVTQIGGGAGSDVLNLPKGSNLNQAGTSGTANGASFTSIEQVNLPVDPIVLPGLNSSATIPALEPAAFELSAFRNLRDSAHAALDGDAEDNTFACANPEETEVALAKEKKPNRFAKVKDQVLACFRGKHNKKTKPGKQQQVLPAQPQSAAPALFPLAMAPVEQQPQPQSEAPTAQPAVTEPTAQPEQAQDQQLDTFQTNFSEGYSAQTKPFSKQAPKTVTPEVVQ